MKVQKESQIRTTVRICEYTEADLYIMLANMPTYHRARKIGKRPAGAPVV